MNVTVKKFLFVGSSDAKQAFLQQAQKAGIIHFIDPHPVASKEMPTEVAETVAAIRVLRHLPTVDQEENAEIVDIDQVIKSILELRDREEKLLEERRVLFLEIERIRVFGHFSLEDADYIEKAGRRTIQFFCAKPTVFDEMPEPEELIYIGAEHSLDYYMAINPQPVSYDKMVEIKIDQPLDMLEKRYRDADQELASVEHQLKSYAKYNQLVHQALVHKLNRYDVYTVQNYIQQAMDGTLFAVEGWVPDTRINELDALIDQTHIYAEEIAIEPADVVPTYLENEGFHRLGEDLVHIYDTPSATDKDPSIWVLAAFTVFFSFIVGDAGYGLAYLALALFLRYKFPNLTGLKKRILNIFTVLCVGCVVWGTLMTSFFGIQIAPDNPIRRLSLIQWLASKKADFLIHHQGYGYHELLAKYPGLEGIQNTQDFLFYSPPNLPGQTPVLTKLSDNVMFELALFIGVVHLMLSLLRYSGRNWNSLGWVVFLFGAYLYFPYHLQVPGLLNYVGRIDIKAGGEIGFDLMIGGLLFACIGSIIRYGITGVFELMVLIQVFADVLSYLRLYALALAGAIVASTVNDIAAGIPFVFGALLVVISHGMNLVLGTMSGVIHGLRLNFLEWYHYSFEGGGRKFKPLKLLKME